MIYVAIFLAYLSGLLYSVATAPVGGRRYDPTVAIPFAIMTGLYLFSLCIIVTGE